MWSVGKARVQQAIRDHGHYVQGVAWDPRGDFIVSVSCDRSARVYSSRAKKGAGRVDFCCTATLAKTRRTGLDVNDAAALAQVAAGLPNPKAPKAEEGPGWPCRARRR